MDASTAILLAAAFWAGILADRFIQDRHERESRERMSRARTELTRESNRLEMIRKQDAVRFAADMSRREELQRRSMRPDD